MTAMSVVWRLAFATSLIVLAFAIAAPVLAIILQQAGHGTTTVGAFAMIPFLMVALLIPVVPRVLARWGIVRAYRWGCVLQLAAILGYALGDGLAVWSIAAVSGGIGAAALWNATEALLAREAPPERRGRVMGLYQTGLGAALALGPFVPALLGWSARPVLWAAVVLVAICCAIAVAVPRHATTEPAPHPAAGTWHALRAAPLLAAIALIGGVFEAGLSSVSAAYASATGLGLGAAATVAGAIGVGSFACQYPAGYAADHFRPANVFAAAALLLFAASVAVAFAGVAPWLLWAAGVVWGGVGGALYTLTMVQVAHQFDGRATAGGAAAMITGYTAGGTVGPLASGTALDFAGVGGLAATLGLLALVALWAALRLEEPRPR
ncbi:MFS transporter [Ramlibacter sp. RBP-2]|uniref:MFS transporter n=1 Tax=Ramlibacter lithotrophicus TaxID=2606681 RepID=A0A7X6DG73_9BURK|nr:MFS transporter [Ramlibacter lithotrophicus]NKE66567.1 MFS transporter [Ramlibacter lithotrophicus]